MKRQIRLLVENLFDDEFDNIYNDTDLDSEITDEYIGYKVGDIYYKDKKPFAICCGDKSDFQNNKFRFCLYNKMTVKRWSTIYDINSINDFNNGLLNLQSVLKEHDIKKFPAFNYCYKLGENVYLPAINELKILFKNIEKLKFKNIEKLKTLNNIKFNLNVMWSSNEMQESSLYALVFNFTDGNILDYLYKHNSYPIIPFIQI